MTGIYMHLYIIECVLISTSHCKTITTQYMNVHECPYKPLYCHVET